MPVEASLEYVDEGTASIKLLEEVEEWEVLLVILGTTHDSNPSFVQTISVDAPLAVRTLNIPDSVITKNCVVEPLKVQFIATRNTSFDTCYGNENIATMHYTASSQNIACPHKYSSHVHSNLDSIFPVIKTSASIPGTITTNGTTYANQTCTARDEYELILNFGDIRSTCGCNVFWNFGYMAGIIVIDLSLDGISWATVDRYSTDYWQKGARSELLYVQSSVCGAIY